MSNVEIERAVELMHNIIRKCEKEHKMEGFVDFAWSLLSEIEDPLKKGYPFKFLTIYVDDFIENHIIIYGEDFTSRIRRYDFNKLVCWRIKRIKELLKARSQDLKMIKIICGEALRLLALAYGAKNLSKKEIAHVLDNLVPEFPTKTYTLRIWKYYLKGKELDEELINFIPKTMGEALKLVSVKFNCQHEAKNQATRKM